MTPQAHLEHELKRSPPFTHVAILDHPSCNQLIHAVLGAAVQRTGLQRECLDAIGQGKQTRLLDFQLAFVSALRFELDLSKPA